MLLLISSYEYTKSTMAPVMAPTIDTTDEVSPKELGYVCNPYRYAGYEYLEQIGIYDLNARYYNPEIARFLSPDPYYNLGNRVIGLYEINVPNAWSIMQANNIYVYCGNSPIAFFDPCGLAPTIEAAAYISDHIYDYDLSNTKTERTIAGWTLVDVFDGGDISSVKIGVYVPEGETIDDASEYVIAFRGSTTDFKDLETWQVWANNLSEWKSNTSIDMWTTMAYAQAFDLTHSQEITFVGHSKGGGEAIAAASITSNNAITFNAANFNYPAYGIKPNPKSVILNFYIFGEVLSSAIGMSKYGINIFVKPYYYNEYSIFGKKVSISNPIKNHGIDAFLEQWKEDDDT